MRWADLWCELALGEAVGRSTRASGTVPAVIGNAAGAYVGRGFGGRLRRVGRERLAPEAG